MKLGDVKTKFFHRFLVAKKNKSYSELVNNQEVPTSSYMEIEGLILDFCRLLYTKAPQAGHFPSPPNWAVVSNDQNKSLTSEFSVEETKSALKMLGRSKTPGPDGFTAAFLIKFWINISIKKNRTSIILSIYNFGHLKILVIYIIKKTNGP